MQATVLATPEFTANFRRNLLSMNTAKIEVRHLKLIKAIDEHEGLTKAAEKLFLTQSALSHQLRELESALGTKVFLRVGKKLILTESGRILLGQAESILAQLDQAFRKVRDTARGERGHLRICVQCYTGYHWLPSILKQFNKKYPNVEVIINTDDITRPLTQVLKGKLDLALVFRKDADGKKIDYHPLFKDDLVALVPEGHPWSSLKSVKATDFKTETVITHNKHFENTSLHQRVFSPAGVKPKRVICIQITEAAIEMVKAGMGVAVMASWAVEPYRSTKKIVAVPIGTGLVRQWYAAVLKNGERPMYIDHLIAQLQQKIKIKPSFS